MPKQKTFKVQCLDCDYADDAIYPYQTQEIRQIARQHAKNFGHTIKETTTIHNYYQKKQS